MITYFTRMESPIGLITLTSDGTNLTGLYMELHKGYPEFDGKSVEDANAIPFVETKEQLKCYFAGKLKKFSIPLKAKGTDFQLRVWKELENIPFGEAISYAELAHRIGNPKASRAVGLANGKNPISIIVPCHRVIGANGKLTGYGGGLPRKEFLLNLETPALVKQLALV